MADFSILAVFDHPEQKLWGNTAAVILLDSFPSKKHMQALARDINQPATTFLVATDTKNQYDVRWFAPDSEIRLCGHGTLAAVAFLNSTEEIQLNARNHVLRGQLTGKYQARMDIEAIASEQASIPHGLSEALGVPILSYRKTNNKDLVIIENEQMLVDMKPDFAALRDIEVFGYAVTAPGDTTDFVSRTIVPHVVQLEDHATGSSHAALAPYWAERLNTRQMKAIQRSPRGGSFGVEITDNIVRLSGHFTEILKSDISYLHR